MKDRDLILAPIPKRLEFLPDRFQFADAAGIYIAEQEAQSIRPIALSLQARYSACNEAVPHDSQYRV